MGDCRKAIIITGSKYPQEDAGALRQHAFAKILQMLGYEVVVLGYGQPTGGRVCRYDGISYTSFRPDHSNAVIRALYRLFFTGRSLRFIRKNIPDVAVVLAGELFPWDMARVARYAGKKQIALLHDSVEWYSPEEFKNGEKSLAYRMNDHLNRKVIRNGWRVIAISRYLQSHFEKQCDRTVRIPVIMGMEDIQPRLDMPGKREKIIISYVGSPGTKDYLAVLISGFSLLTPEEKSKVEFHVIGVNEAQLTTVCAVDPASVEALNGVLHIHGRMPHAEAVEWVRDSDYTVMLRDETLRYAMAGFPTKIVESLSYGTPVICNFSSDLADYLKDQRNAFVIPGHTPEDVRQTISRALFCDANDRTAMRQNARQTAEEHFDYIRYAETMKELVEM